MQEKRTTKSKMFGITREAEEQQLKKILASDAGKQLLQLLNRDGAHGSTLTDEGNRLLDAYLDIDERLRKIAEDEFSKLF